MKEYPKADQYRSARITGRDGLVRPNEQRDGGRGSGARSKLRILRLVLEVAKGWSTYYQYSVAAPENQDITLCSLFPFDGRIHSRLKLIQGDGSVFGYIRLLRNSVDISSFDLVHAHTPHVAALYLISRLAGKKSAPIPTVYTFHNSYHNYSQRNRLLLIPVFASFDQVVCCGQASLETLPRLYRTLAGKRLSAIPNGVDFGQIDSVLADKAMKPKPGSGRPFTIATVGRLISIKNPFAVLDAFSKLDDTTSRLLVMGEGELRQALTSYADSLAVRARVEFTGLISREQVLSRLAEADLFVSASYGEGLPNAVLEAMACRCPAVLSDIAPHREIAGKEGVVPLFPPADSSALADQIRRIQRLPKSERVALGARCREIVESRFALTDMHERYEAVYRALLRASGGNRRFPQSPGADQ